MPIMEVVIQVTTQDDNTLDAVLDAFEAFAKGDLRDIIHDPLATISVVSSEGDAIHC